MWNVHSKCFRQRHRGFSLLELVLVLAITVTLSAIALPRYGRASARYQADGAAKVVMADLQLAQRRARAGSGNCTVTFRSEASDYQITLPTLNGVAGRVIKTDLAAPPYRAKIKLAAFGNSSVVIFDGYGIPLSGGSVRIVCGNEERVVTVAATTGAISIQ